MTPTDTILATNSAAAAEADDFFGLVVANQYDASTTTDNWVQLSPFGRFPNRVGLQVFTPEDAQVIANEFDSLPSIGVKAVGLPWYVGHPDMPDRPEFKSFREQYKDGAAKGRIKQLENRHDPKCKQCQQFCALEANQAMATGVEPCRKHGLFGNVRWNDDGKKLIANEAFHGHSTSWRMRPVNGEWHPFSLKSVGFTNEPNIPVPAITTANEKSMPKKTLMDYVSKLLKKPELAEQNDEPGAVDGLDAYTSANAQLAADHEKLKTDNAALQKKHGDLINTMAGLASAYGANEALDAAVTAANTDRDSFLSAWAANELSARAATIAAKTAEVTAANARLTELTTLAANVRKDFAGKLGTLLLQGGFLSRAELDVMTTGKDFANEGEFTAFVAATKDLKPKYPTMSILPPLGHMSADLQSANVKTVERTDAIVTAVNEYQDAQQARTGKRPDYMSAFGHIQKTRKELFAQPETTITR